MTDEPEGPWYRDGLAFTCTRCGDCCTGAPGYVWVGDAEVRRIAEFLNMSPEAFAHSHVRQVGTRRSLIEKPNGECVFWSRESGCTIYEVRPPQCRTWPFWADNIATPEAWERTCAICPGSGQGAMFSLEEIEAAVRRSRP